jgi:uncharacterized repeat protein (TIGR02059 family)
MRIVFITLFLALSSYLAATDYYVKNGGNDLAQGTSDATAWATIEKVNSVFSTLKPGDRILFKKGDKFYGTIIISKSGTSGSPITIGSYGTGDKPIITGFTEITSWTDEGGGIYSAALNSEALTNMVTISGKQYAMGRWPDDGYNIFESASSNTSITDKELGSDVNWKDAEVVIRKNDWSYDRCKINTHSGGVLTYTSLGSKQLAEPNHGYFIQNDLRTLTRFGEWYHDISAEKIYIYFGTTDPESLVVEIATLKNLVYNNGNDYITIDNINFKGSISNLVEFVNNSCDYLTIQNSFLQFAGLDGINLWGKNGIISKNSISSCNQTGIKALGDGHTIINNVIENIGLIVGQAFWGNLTNGIAVADNNCLIKYNNIQNIGYNGIKLSSTADIITIQNNYIHDVLLTLNDGGGIYTAAEGISRKIDGNIILNVIGNTAGTPYPDRHIARGIYLDVKSTNVIVTNNTVANCNEAGYMIHRAHDNKIENNTAFNNGYGMYFQNNSESNIRNNSLKNNLFIAKGSTQLALKFFSLADDIPKFGTADNNHYARPIDDGNVIHTSSPSTGSKYRTLAGWQSFTGQDRNSKKSAVTVSDTSRIDFHYNPSTSNKVITLNQPMVDVTGKKYSGSVTLLPYTSVILIPDPNPYTPPTPAVSGASIENSAPAVIVLSYNINLASVIPAASAFSVTVNGTAKSVSSVAVSGKNVSLTLSNRVNHGDVVTLSYTKPSDNPIKSTEGAQAASFTSRSVTNNCAAPATTPSSNPTTTTPPNSSPANQPPVISIALPAKGISYTSPASVIIEVTAHDPDGSVKSVTLYDGNRKLGEQTSPPFYFTLKDIGEGSYSIHAIATDNMNASTRSNLLDFMVTDPKPEKGSFRLYPNPNDGNFSIDYDAPDDIEEYKLTVVNSQGRTVLVEELSQDQYMKHFDLSYLVSGIYIVMISTNEIILTQKFIKQ